MPKPCLFCAIARGDEPSAMVFEDGDFAVFLDVRPLFPGHCLIVPRAHVECLWDLPSSLNGPLLALQKRMSLAVRAATGAKGIFTANNNIVSQSVPHLHMHVVPRNPKDGLRGFFWPRTKYESPEAMERVRASIAEALAELPIATE